MMHVSFIYISSKTIEVVVGRRWSRNGEIIGLIQNIMRNILILKNYNKKISMVVKYMYKKIM